MVNIPLSRGPRPVPCNSTDPAEDSNRCATCNASEAAVICGGHGACVHGQCYCDVGFEGSDCSLQLSCQFWNATTKQWSSQVVS